MVDVSAFLDQPDPLAAFGHWYLTRVRGDLGLVPHQAIEKIEIGTAITLFRSPPFLVQLLAFHPGTKIKPHAHPRVDTIVVYLCGDMSLTVGGKELFPLGSTPVLPDGGSQRRGIPVRFLPGVVHSGEIGDTGGALLSIQRWLDGEPTSVHLDWRGEDGSTKG